MSRTTAVLLLAGSLVLAAWVAPAGAETTPEAQLAQKYAPVVRVVAQEEPCGRGEPYEPLDVDDVLGSDEVALRGPWAGSNLVLVAPTAGVLSTGLFGYHLDFPGNALSPHCTYEQWSRRISGSPTTY